MDERNELNKNKPVSVKTFQENEEYLAQLLCAGIGNQDILNNINSHIVITDKNFRVTYINQTIQEMFGFHPDVVQRKDLFEINLPGIDLNLYDNLLQVLQKGDNFYSEAIRFLTPSKEERFLKHTCIPLRDKQNKINGLILIGKDVTSKILEEMNHQTNKSEDWVATPETPPAATTVETDLLRREVEDTYQAYNLITKNNQMRQILNLIPRVAESSATVFLSGETGTGKELIAKAIHCNSPRRDKRFIGINCAVLTETLLESELFGYVKGSFTGAIRDKQGKFELADGGTLFLDEVSEMPPATQSQFLRVLQEKEFEKIGGEETIHVDVRIIAASNRKLEELVVRGKFRQDLYYRLKVISIDLPPLRQRMDDLPLLVTFFLKKYSDSLKKDVVSISQRALNKMLAYHWPGNVRELESLIEKTVVMNQGAVIKDVELPGDDAQQQPHLPIFQDHLLEWSAYLEHCEEHYFRELFSLFKGHIKQISQASKLNRRTIHNKMKKYRLFKQDFK